VDIDIHEYIHVWISNLGHAVDISMDIIPARLLINCGWSGRSRRQTIWKINTPNASRVQRLSSAFLSSASVDRLL